MEHLQPYMFMMMSSMKKDNDSPTFIILIIIGMILFKLFPLNEIKTNIANYLNNYDGYFRIIIPSHEVPILRTLSNVPATKIIYSKDFLAIIHYLSLNNISSFNSITEIISSNSELNTHYCDDNPNKDNKFLYIPINNTKIVISEQYKIYFELTENKNTSDEKTDDSKNTTHKIIKHPNFVIVLSIYKNQDNNINILTNFIKECLIQYEQFIDSNIDNSQQYLYSYKGCEKSESIIDLKYDEFKMEHNKDLLVNIFFENKDKLINYITPFIYDPFEKINLGEEKYKRSGFTFKAGLLFYGSPGCGKTSTIKAILKYTNRHGIIINLSKIKSCEELECLFRNRKIKKRIFSGKQLCFILEDCDAFENNIIKSRKIEEKPVTSEKCEKSDLLKLMEMSASKPISTNEDILNLSCFLNILDGIIEMHGVMVIMTTNHPEKIDDALIRPGRFDFKYEFKKASSNIIKDMLQFKFDLSSEESDEYLKDVNFPNEVLSPAEIQAICFKYDNIKYCIDELLTHS